jgi:hypothetical protein
VKGLELAFATKPIRNLCERVAHAEKKLGLRVAGLLFQTLSDLRAAANVSEVFVGAPNEVTIDGRKEMMLNLGNGAYLCFSSNHSRKTDAAAKRKRTNWSDVTRIQITRIEVPNA